MEKRKRTFIRSCNNILPKVTVTFILMKQLPGENAKQTWEKMRSMQIRSKKGYNKITYFLKCQQ